MTTAGQLRTLWTTQATGATGSGIWHSGGALVADGPNRILLATGNGNLIPSGPTPGNTPPPDLSEAVVRLDIQPNGHLKAVDFFTPYDAEYLDLHDRDFGSAGPVFLPESYEGTPLFGTAEHPHLTVQVGKEGKKVSSNSDHVGE